MPADIERLKHSIVWAPLFAQTVGCDANPAWAGSFDELIDGDEAAYAAVSVQVYPSDIDTSGGEH